MVDLGGYVIILVETKEKKVKLYGKLSSDKGPFKRVCVISQRMLALVKMCHLWHDVYTVQCQSKWVLSLLTQLALLPGTLLLLHRNLYLVGP